MAEQLQNESLNAYEKGTIKTIWVSCSDHVTQAILFRFLAVTPVLRNVQLGSQRQHMERGEDSEYWGKCQHNLIQFIYTYT